MTPRTDRIIERVRAIPEGFVRTYGDIDPGAPRVVGCVLSRLGEAGPDDPGSADVPWHRVVRVDGSLPVGAEQRARLHQEGVPLRGDRVDMARARLPPEAS